MVFNEILNLYIILQFNQNLLLIFYESYIRVKNY